MNVKYRTGEGVTLEQIMKFFFDLQENFTRAFRLQEKRFLKNSLHAAYGSADYTKSLLSLPSPSSFLSTTLSCCMHMNHRHNNDLFEWISLND